MRALFAAALLAGAVIAAPAYAGMGPCKPDAHDGLICGDGIGAARVIRDTTSPDEKFAFAWRDPGSAPTTEPDKDDHDLLLVRLSDGAILAASTTEYWNTGEMRANRRDESVAWSPDSHLAVRGFQTRFKTERLEAYALGKDANAAASLDLLKIVEPAVRKKLSKTAGSRVFTLRDDQTVDVGNDGAVHFLVQMWLPKEGPEDFFDVSLKITRGPKGELKTGAITVKTSKPLR